MKKLPGTNLIGKNSLTAIQWSRYLTAEVLVFFALIFCIALLSGCSKQQPEMQAKEPIHKSDNLALNSDEEFIKAYKAPDEKTVNSKSSNGRFSFITFLELLQARIATAKYQNLERAIADGYTDINVVIPHMGHHYLKAALLDVRFEVTKPEILVYKQTANRKFQLVAVEYAVPIDLSPNGPPEGFTGQNDAWHFDEDFQLWTLHAWVWHFNPDGVFSPLNPLVP